ncbi:D-aminoacyl-tRNA deacylase [Fulvivirgaceae bacterium BMA10]|uniref:D-aminoacyl-tRNA deacylase n=1 Tax=Splendidivirga corallicola TaxID=3051826 RepID=A0ABT8KSQ2_9BACT|nr:D-aminoacyl-tRNA deacylase [Fulvivirgaceae bacterium BMA10]
MIAVVQRVSEASVNIAGSVIGKIEGGVLLLLGIEEADNQEDISWLSKKVVNLRIFNDEAGIMNKSLIEVGGNILIVSQFTLHASTKKGNRPSYIKAAKPDVAIPMYERFIRETEQNLGRKIQTGEFGADMKVQLTNDGPVTIIINTKDKK